MNRKRRIFLLALAASSLVLLEGAALADSVYFKTGPVSIQVLAKNFKTNDIKAFLECVFSIDREFFHSYPTQELKLKYQEVQNNLDEAGTLYQVEIEAGSLFAWKPLLYRNSCRYLLVVTDAGLTNDWSRTSVYVGLADSRDEEYQSSLSVFLADKKMNEKISSRYQPLKLEEKDGNRVEVVQ